MSKTSSPTHTAGAPALSVVVLAYHAGAGFTEFVAELAGSLADLEGGWEILLVVNDWPESDDPTPSRARELAARDARIRLVDEAKRGGMGWDMRCGLAAARGASVAVIDGDGQMPGRDVLRVYQATLADGADLGTTFRSERDDGALRRALSFGFNALFRLLFPGLGVRDVNSKPKVLRREALERMQLAANDWFIDAEMLIAARRLRLRIVEIPTTFGALEGRPSFVRLSAVLEFLRNFARSRIGEWRR